MVDYSKWDNLVVSSSDDDEANDDAKRKSTPNNHPEVTRLSKPAKVTFGNGAVHYRNPPSPSPSASTASHPKPSPPTSKSPQLSVQSRKDLAENGADHGRYLWSQTGSELTLTLLLPRNAKARDVKLTLTTSGRLLCSFQGNPMMDEQLCRDVWGAPEARTSAMAVEGKLLEEEGEGFRLSHPQLLGVTAETLEAHEMEWAVEDAPADVHDGRWLVVTLQKLTPNEQIKEEWWDRLFISETTRVDTSTIASRKSNSGKGQSFKDAWEEAHAEFVRRRKAGEPPE